MTIFRAKGVHDEIVQLRSEVQSLKDIIGSQLVPKQSFDALLKEYKRVTELYQDMAHRMDECVPILQRIMSIIAQTKTLQRQNLDGFAQAVRKLKPEP